MLNTDCSDSTSKCVELLQLRTGQLPLAYFQPCAGRPGTELLPQIPPQHWADLTDRGRERKGRDDDRDSLDYCRVNYGLCHMISDWGDFWA